MRGFQGRLLGLQRGLRAFQRHLFAAQALQAAIEFAGHTLLALQLGRQLLDALVLAALLGGHALLLLAQFGQLVFQLFDLQLERFTAAGDRGLGRHHLATDILDTPGSLLADTREALLGGHQLLLHQADLLKTPPAQPAEGDRQGADQRPQGAGTGRPGWRRSDAGRRPHGGFVMTRSEIIAIPRVGGQAGHMIEFVVGIVTHE
ncbi:hypothetical protein D3C86_1401220 [compost metagenome]